MAGLAGQTGTVSDESLYLLHASMAVNTTLDILDILDKYDPDYSTLISSNGALLLKSMAAVAQETLSKTVYEAVFDPDATAPLQLGDVINASVEFSRDVVKQITTDMEQNNGVPNIAMIDAAVLAAPAIHDMVSIHYHGRLGSAPTAGTDPVPVPTPVDGQALYDGNCASCHVLGNYDVNGSAPQLGGLGNTVISKIESGHKGFSLTADELNALADWADANPAPSPDPLPTRSTVRPSSATTAPPAITSAPPAA
jgi:mono/diheme cytochrome c family protein